MKIWMTALAVLAACTGLLAADGPVKVEVNGTKTTGGFTVVASRIMYVA